MRNRWTVLAAGTFAQTAYSAAWFGAAVMAPELRDMFHVGLAEIGLLLSASLLGSLVSLIPWGLATDRLGERVVLITGLGSSGLALLAASRADSFEALFALLLLSGALGASVQSASGRAVMAWFPSTQRGLALGIRQTAVPIAGFLTAIVLPPVVKAGGAADGFILLGVATLVAAVVGGLVLAEPPRLEAAEQGLDGGPLRDARIWRVSIAAGLVVAPQMCVVGFTVLLLHDHRGLAVGMAALVLAVVQFLGIGGRIAAGRWSDVVGSRIGPFRTLAVAVTGLVLCAAVLLSAPLAVLLPVLIAAGVLSMSWNGLAFAATVEFAGHRRSGAAIGLQQSILNGTGAVYPALFGVLVGTTSWSLGFLAVGLLPLAGWGVLRGLGE
jgi:sugar phosphate permease